ncbi:replication initiation factor domain-containing protein [Lacticaseibacillus pantheris]
MQNDLTAGIVVTDWLGKFWDLMTEQKLTQQQVADKVGITRGYLNQLLGGKKPLNGNMRRQLMCAYRELSGDEALTMWIDYVRIRFPTHDPIPIMTELLQIKPIFFAPDNWGFYGYTGKFEHGAMQIFTSPEDDDRGTLLELKGEGCREFECLLLAQHRSWYDFFEKANELGGHYNRIDLAINDYVDMLPVQYFIDKCDRDEFTSIFRRIHKDANKEHGVIGRTLYIGSRKSQFYMCLYQKDAEQFFKYGTPLDQTPIKNRFELRLADERATKAIEALLNERDPAKVIFGIINRYVRFLKPNGKARASWPLDDLWANFIGKYGEKLRLTTQPEPFSIKRTYNWIEKQVAPTLKMLLAYDSATAQDILMTMIANAKITQKEMSVLQAMLASTEEMIIPSEESKKSDYADQSK